MRTETSHQVPPRDDVLAELSRIVESRWFRESHHLRALLTHVVTETLEGRETGLKEYNLGVNVLHRAPDYDPRTDAIVRVQVSQLRKKLQSFYEDQRDETGFRIEIPKGTYVPVFAAHRKPLEPSLPAAPAAQVPRAPKVWLAFLAGAVLMGVSLWLAGLGPRVNSGLRQSTPVLWTPFLDREVPAIVSFGVPLFYVSNGLYIRDVQVNEPGTEMRSRIEHVSKAMNQLFRPHDDVYTGIGETVGTYEVGRYLESRGVTVQIANSHYLGPSDLRGKNLVIVSSSRFQTPLNQFRLPEAFPFDAQEVNGGYLNRTPLPGESSRYDTKSAGASGVSTSYATVCVWPGTSESRRLILISGINSWCTLAAARYAMDTSSQSDLERRLGADPAFGPRGRKGPYYQVLIRTEGKYDQVRSFEYVAHRYLGARPIRAE